MVKNEKGNDGYKKIEDLIVKFTQKGDKVEGVLIGRETGANFGNEVYKLKDENDVVFTIFGTSVLESLMASVKEGEQVKIVYTGDKPNPKPGQNPIKLFDVFRKDA